MLRMLHSDGVGTVVLTPHFYAGRDYPERFLARRARSLASLQEHIALCTSEVFPTLIPGAEVEYFEGITVMSELPLLRLGRTPCLLLEMPRGRWTSHMIDDILELHNRPDIHVILAHIERYARDQKKETLPVLVRNGVRMQANASFFLHRFHVKKAVRAAEHGLIHLIGSDCHNTTSRPPNIGMAFDALEKYAGAELTAAINRRGGALLQLDSNTADRA